MVNILPRGYQAGSVCLPCHSLPAFHQTQTQFYYHHFILTETPTFLPRTPAIFRGFNFNFIFQALVLLFEVCLCQENVAEVRSDQENIR